MKKARGHDHRRRRAAGPAHGGARPVRRPRDAARRERRRGRTGDPAQPGRAQAGVGQRSRRGRELVREIASVDPARRIDSRRAVMHASSHRSIARHCAASLTLAHGARRRAVDFIADAKLFYRVVACGGRDPLPAGARRADVDEALRRDGQALRALHREVRHAGAGVLRRRCARRPCRRRSSIRSAAATSRARSSRIPTRARSRRSRSSTPAIRRGSRSSTRRRSCATALSAYRDAIDGLLTLNDSTSENMRKLERGGIPGQLSFHITGMTAHRLRAGRRSSSSRSRTTARSTT